MADYVEATERLQSQLEAYPGVLNPAFFDNPISHRDAIATVSALVADQFVAFPEGKVATPDAVVDYLTEWRESLKGACSDEYKALTMGDRGITEGLDRESLNRQPKLIILNGLRLGVSQALRLARSRYDAERHGHRWNKYG